MTAGASRTESTITRQPALPRLCNPKIDCLKLVRDSFGECAVGLS
jgi:hypothetical protein